MVGRKFFYLLPVQEKTLFLGTTVINRSKKKNSQPNKKKILGRGQNGGSVSKHQTNNCLRSALQLLLTMIFDNNTQKTILNKAYPLQDALQPSSNSSWRKNCKNNKHTSI